MREQNTELGGKPVTYAADGRLMLHGSYEGWRPPEPRDWGEAKAWALVIICGALVCGACRALGI